MVSPVREKNKGRMKYILPHPNRRREKMKNNQDILDIKDILGAMRREMDAMRRSIEELDRKVNRIEEVLRRVGGMMRGVGESKRR